MIRVLPRLSEGRLRRHPTARSQGHRAVHDFGAGRMRACAIVCQASRCAVRSCRSGARDAMADDGMETAMV